MDTVEPIAPDRRSEPRRTAEAAGNAEGQEGESSGNPASQTQEETRAKENGPPASQTREDAAAGTQSNGPAARQARNGAESQEKSNGPAARQAQKGHGLKPTVTDGTDSEEESEDDNEEPVMTLEKEMVDMANEGHRRGQTQTHRQTP